MPPKKAEQVFLVISREGDGDAVVVHEVHATRDSANAAKGSLEAEQDDDLEVLAYDVKQASKTTQTKAPAKSKPKPKTKKAAEPEDEDEDDEDEGATEQAKVTSKKAKPDDKRKAIPEGKAGALDGLRLLFTGTFEIDRKTCESTAIKYGAELVSKLVDTDYIVLGTKPGPKKVQEIQEKGLNHISEAQFYEMIQGGPDAKKKQKR